MRNLRDGIISVLSRGSSVLFHFSSRAPENSTHQPTKLLRYCKGVRPYKIMGLDGFVRNMECLA